MSGIDHVLYLLSIVLGAAGAWAVARYGSCLGLVDLPSERSSHLTPTPKGGGIGILGAFLLVSLLVGIPLEFLLAAAFLALFSFWGDRTELSPGLRLPIQFLSAAIIILGIQWNPSEAAFTRVVAFAAAMVYLVGTANFYNFMDGINGMAAITGLVCYGLLALFGYSSGLDRSLTILAVCISLSCAGFLPFNLPKARVFMGDVGSILLGFGFAAMVLLLSRSLLDFISLNALLFPFFADELTTMTIRIRNGETLTHPHRKHLYQLLANERGISHWKISTGYGVAQVLVGVSIMAGRHFGAIVVCSMLAAYFTVFALISCDVRKRVLTRA
jgi:UDP-N-acetylmuramyl pentapeptide phosphotransferase/UDP-N-acetylglucosamine-1-phosphate transferase